jgi:maltodextrin utilization protein YvdJ
MTQGNAALNVLFTSLAKGDFDGFTQRLKEAVTEAGRFADKMDALGDKEEAYNILNSETRIKLQAIRNEMMLSNTTATRRLQLADQYDKLVNAELARSLELEDKRKGLLIDRIAAETKANRTEAQWFVDNYSRNAQLIEVAGELNDKIDEYHKNTQKITSQKLYGTYQQRAIDYAIKRNSILRNEIFNLSTEQREFLRLFPIMKEDADLWQQITQSIQKHNGYLLEAETLKGRSMKAEARAQNQTLQLNKQQEKEAEKKVGIAFKIQKEYADDVDDIDKAQLESRGQTADAMSEATRKGMLEQIGIVEQGAADISLTNQKTEDEITKDIEKAAAERNAIREAEAEAAITIAKSVADSFFKIKEAQNRRQLEADLEAAGDNKALQDKANREYAKRERDMAVFQINLNGAIASAKVWATSASVPQAVAQQIIVAGETAAQLIAAETAYQSLKFRKGGHGEIYGKSHEQGGTYIPGVGEAEGGEYFSVFNKQATKKHQSIIGDFTDAVNQDRLDLFALNFVPKVNVDNERLTDIAIQQLAVQRSTKELIAKQKSIRGKTEIDLKGNRIHYC